MNKAMLSYTKFWLLLALTGGLFSTIAKAQTPTNCLEIGSILVDACGSPEGENEMVRFQVGPTAIATSNLTVTWPNNSFLGISPVNTTTTNIVTALNATILSCGYLVQPVGGMLPAGKTVLLITSTNVSLSANSFANLTDTLYVIFQNAGNTAGHFANYSTPSGIRTLTMGTISPACSDAVSYDKVLLINQTGGHGGSSAVNDGATVEFNWTGTANYVNNGCQAPFVSLTSNAGSNATMCASGTIALTGTASGNYTGVIWSSSTGTFSNPGSLSTNYTAAASGPSPVTLSLGVIGHCHDTVFSTISISITPAPTPTIAASGSTTFCQGGSVMLTASGGSSYAWSTGANTSSISVSTAGTYTVTATGACGSQQATQTVTVNPLPTATITPSGATTFCSGDSVTLAASGTGAYSWSTGATGNSITVHAAGTYTLTSTNGCGSQQATQAITVNPLPHAVITPSGSTTFCTGGSVTLTASGGTSYAWSTGATISSITVATAGTYTVTVTNSCGSQTATQVVTTTATPVATISSSGNSFCAGSHLVLHATGSGSYTWTGGSTADSLVVTAGGTYIVTSATTCGNASDTITVTQNPLPAPVITPSGPTTFCSGGSVTLTASGGTSYAWSNGSTANSITVSTAGTYTLTATNSCGSAQATQVISTTTLPAATINSAATSFCSGSSVVLHATGSGNYTWTGGSTADSLIVTAGGTYIVTSGTTCGNASDTITITQNPLPTAVITASGSTTFCTGDSVTLNASGGTSYAWSNGSTASSITVSTAGTYTLTATNSCGSAQATQVVNTTTTPAASIHSAAGSFCAGSSLTLYATGSGSYTWNGGSTNDSITVTTGGTYYVTALSTCGNAGDTITITQNPLPAAVITPSGSTTICAGSTVTLNGSGGTTYLWLPTGASTNAVSAATAGTYTLAATNGCGTDTATSTVTIINAPNAVITPAGSTTLCAGDNVTLTASGGATYVWSTGQTGASITAGSSGTYWVVTSNSCGTDTSAVSVNVDSVTASFTSSTLSGLYPLPVNFTNTSSASAVGFVWNFADNSGSSVTSPSHTFQTPGTYVVTLTATNANGCTDTYSVTIIVLENPSILEIPNVFTPNADNDNDVFVVKSEGITEFDCSIYDRWGIKMADLSAASMGWDGRTSSGQPAVDGTYFYIVKAKGADGKEYDKSGYLQLIRK